MKRARRGFTMLEMLAVIGIMLILISLSVIGFEQLDRSGSGKQTRVLLDDCQSMLKEYQADSGDSDLTGLTQNWSGYPYSAGGNLGYFTPATPPLPIEVTDMVNTNTANTNGRYGTPGAVANTWYVMSFLMRDPKVRDIVNKLPPNRILTAPNQSGTGTPVPWYPGFPGTPPTGYNAGDGVVLLDAWGNPIIFVPPGGINVWLKNQTAPYSVKSTDGLPFWASAGPDGNFGADLSPTPPSTGEHGDDNIYSFENGQ